MEIVFWVFFGLIILGFLTSLIQFSYQRPFTIIIMMFLAFAISPNENYGWTALSLIGLSWLFTSRDGLVMVGAFVLGLFYGSRK
ncbi:MAG: hypothetical protein AWU56_2276 [Idiomarina sp. T82-3]|uniref:hypothetical protein n=1 Tax=Idiomarina TaxID=135575 RepID=UPI000796AFDB|nr:hypothetical protein [Idiomarina sp. T82-3]KXS34185.1 MAG: hypothetical protein AWU56_2276 [Idiomarina sp. T82-3]